MTILYLYAELMGYQMPVFKEYIASHNAKVHVVHWDHKKKTPYEPEIIANVTYYKRSELDRRALLELATSVKPDIVYVSGWMDKEYIFICGKMRSLKIPVVAGCDTQWRGGLKQILGSFYFKLFLRKNFSHIWVAGPYQFEYARKLSFKKHQIIFNCLTADTEVFKSESLMLENIKHQFLFVGRFEEIKGVRLLLAAWESITDQKDWTLTFIGNGSLGDEIRKHKNVIAKNFLQPQLLVKEFGDAGCFILPSFTEPWALVIHEAVSMGLPVIASDSCGAAPVFITPFYNGFTFKSGDMDDLKRKMTTIINMTDDELLKYSQRSLGKSKQINAEVTASTFISTIDSQL